MTTVSLAFISLLTNRLLYTLEHTSSETELISEYHRSPRGSSLSLQQMLLGTSAYIKLKLGEQKACCLICKSTFTNSIKSSHKSVKENLTLVGQPSGKNGQNDFLWLRASPHGLVFVQRSSHLQLTEGLTESHVWLLARKLRVSILGENPPLSCLAPLLCWVLQDLPI